MESLLKAIKVAGSQQALADRVNQLVPQSERIGQSAVSEWLRRGRVPAEKVIVVSRVVDYSVTPHELRSDLYPHPEDGLPEDRRALATFEGVSEILKPGEAAAVRAAIAHGPESTSNAIAALEPVLEERLDLLRDAESRS